ncbi:MAG: citrate/2-methylcitrate synthase, partial [Myxococcota bacterium]
MTTREATELLGIKAATLYTYVSRGLIRSVPSPTDSRRKLYLRTDVERLKARHDARAGHAAAASEALQWGQPVIDTAISHISSEGPLYRGRSAAELAYAGVGFEAVAEWLWAETPPLQRTVWPSPPHTSTLVEALGLHVQPGEDFLSVLMGAVSLAGLADVGRHGAPPEADMARARSLIRRLPAWLSLAVGPERYTAALQAKSVAGSFATALGRSSPEVEAGIERALIVCADHELNASSFAARVAASTGA